MPKVSSLSQLPWFSVDDDGVLSEHNVDNGIPNPNGCLNLPSKYSSQVRKIINDTIPPLWDQIVANLLWWRLVQDVESRDFDVMLPWEVEVEVKTWRIGSTTSIRQGQLEKLASNWYYGLVYYETKNNRSTSPAFYVQKCLDEEMNLTPEVYLRRMISIKTVLIIAKPSIVYFFNTSQLRLLYNTSGVPYKALARSRAIKLFEENPDKLSREKWKYQFGRHEIEVYSLWKDLDL